MARQEQPLRSKRTLKAVLASLSVASLVALGCMATPAFASDDTTEQTVTEEVTPTETTEEVVEEVASTPEETVVVPEETTPTEETPVVPEEEVVPEEVAEDSLVETFARVNAQGNDDNTNSEEYWEDDNTQCFKHEGADMLNNDHGYLSDDGIYVILKTFVQAWFGDHFSLLVVNSGSVDNGYGPGNAVYTDPVSGLAETYSGPLNAGGQQGTVSHWIVCKGETPPPPPVEAQECTEKGNYLVTNQNEQGFNYSPLGSPYADTRVDGEYEYVDGALELTTNNPVSSSSTNKVSGARAVNIPLAQYGGSFTVNFVVGPTSDGTIEPGINIRLDADGDGDNDVTLVAEPNVAGYFTFWTNTPGYLPASPGGQGGAYAGDQDDILALWPNAIVKVEAFVLGSGVGTDGDLISWSTPCNTYTYDYVEPEIVDPTGSITGTCVADAFVLTGSGTSGSYAATAFIGVDGVEKADEAVAENSPFSLSYNVDLPEGTTFDADLQFGDLYGSADILDSASFTIDCVDDPPPPTPVDITAGPSVTAPTCDAGGKLVIPTIEHVTFAGGVNGAGPGQYTITASADEGYVLTGDVGPWNLTVLPKKTSGCEPVLAFTGSTIGDGSILLVGSLVGSGLFLLVCGVYMNRRRYAAPVQIAE